MYMLRSIYTPLHTIPPFVHTQNSFFGNMNIFKGGCFDASRDNLTYALKKMALSRNVSPRDVTFFCDNVTRAMLMWEDSSYCWQVRSVV